jgi:hypothetical protein
MHLSGAGDHSDQAYADFGRQPQVAGEWEIKPVAAAAIILGDFHRFSFGFCITAPIYSFPTF